MHQAIADAARQTSVDFDYLVAQAQVESSMNPNARAPTSSATGLYQFIESTWLSTMKRHGDRFGLSDIAAQIENGKGGKAFVSDPQQRQAILALRNDPQVASLMAAGLAEDNRAHLAPILGRQPDHGELYLAHFLGAGGAGRFLSAMQADPNQSAAALFRQPAAANRTIFYESNGSPRSLAGVMEHLDAKLQRALGDAPQSQMDGQYPISEAVQPASPGFTPMGGDRSRSASRASLGPLPSAGASSVSMSSVMRATFGGDGGPALASPQTAAQVKRAYDQLKAFGL